MRTVVVRLRAQPAVRELAQELDILGTEDPRERYSAQLARFQAASRGVANYLQSQHGKTFRMYQSAFAASARGELDLLSSEPRIESGIVRFEPLLPSAAYAVTATEDVIERLLHFEAAERVHPNYVYELPDLDVQTAGSASGGSQPWHFKQLGLGGTSRNTCGRSIKVAVLDSGIDARHREFPPGIPLE
jgi:hypothetical protein